MNDVLLIEIEIPDDVAASDIYTYISGCQIIIVWTPNWNPSYLVAPIFCQPECFKPVLCARFRFISLPTAKLFSEAMLFVIIFYLPKVIMQVQNGPGVLSRLVPWN